MPASTSRQAFLLEVTDVLRGSGSTRDILPQVSQMPGRHFGVDRVGYGHVDEALAKPVSPEELARALRLGRR